MIFVFGIVLILIADSLASECWYHDWTANAIQTYNFDNSSFEIVDRTCSVLQNTDTFQAVGDVSGFEDFALNYTDRPELVDLSNATFPFGIELTLENVGVRSLGDCVYEQLTKLTLKDMTMDYFESTDSPDGLQVNLLNFTLINTSTFENLSPARLSIGDKDNFTIQKITWPMLSVLQMTNLYEMTVLDVELQGVKHLSFENVSVRAISHLSLHGLKKVSLRTSNISNWVMDDKTFNILENLEGKNALVNLDAMSIVTVNETYCTTEGGIVRPLWPTLATNYSVCVLKITKSTSNTTGVIVGVSLGCMMLLAMGTMVVWHRKVAALKTEFQLTEITLHFTADEERSLNIQSLDMVRIEAKDVILDKVLGSGAFADVWSGTYCGDLVAIKKLSATNITIAQLQSFVDEIKLMSQFDSPRIVKLIGACWTRPGTLKCVMELMDGGDLRSYLASHSPDEFTWPDKFMHIYSIVEGLVYLHSLDIIHRDLKSRNILLDSTKGTKLTDFGISKEDELQTMTMGVGTLLWMAPEVLQEKHYTVAADIYSFGIILSEFDSHQIPFCDMKNPTTGLFMSELAISSRVAMGELQPTFSSHMPAWLRAIALQCIAQNPDDRPTAVQLTFKLQTELRKLAPELYSL
ncbi:Aste57867_12557 [Aphanomyces stellatus]|uniref:Aste57867_12557 protein n=1 Tax=Aphanomyces stellatus TaxID=120398 RepID=A0A485KWI7_9STRA|nr:hypothetical protein As57867_012511 [Aphanomyces stellatus]VFT89408.1 Aste57867_12557 [Aphanomyces stellatus]